MHFHMVTVSRRGSPEEDVEGCQANVEAKAQHTVHTAPPAAAGQAPSLGPQVSLFCTAPPFLPLPQLP